MTLLLYTLSYTKLRKIEIFMKVLIIGKLEVSVLVPSICSKGKNT